VSGDAAFEVAILERATDGKKRSYLFAREVDGFLKQKKLPPGFRLVAPTFASDGYIFSAVFEQVAGDEQAREYRLVKAGSSGDLRKKFEKGGPDASGVIAIAWGGSGVAATTDSTPISYRVLSTVRLGTFERELQTIAAEGFRLLAVAVGSKEWVAVLAK
jgi:hypothetical protein